MARRISRNAFYEAIFIISIIVLGEAIAPYFTDPIVNLTVPMGRDATFKCLVAHLGGYRVGWVKVDTKAIQAIHHKVITHNPRVTISYSNHATWNLHIKGVQEEDGGTYMCQINTDPMQSQIGTLKIVLSPEIINEETSGDMHVNEGSSVVLRCKASGRPEPRITWRREDGGGIFIRNGTGRTKVKSYPGHVLHLRNILRSEMGVYLCLSSNGVPPSISKRINVSVTFPPVINVPNQLVGTPLGTDVTLECAVEAFPRPIAYWLTINSTMILSSSKYSILETRTDYDTKMSLVVKNFTDDDVGSYRCVAKNSLGEVESSIRLYEIPGAKKETGLYDKESTIEMIDSINQVNAALSSSASDFGPQALLQITFDSSLVTYYYTFSESIMHLNKAAFGAITISSSVVIPLIILFFI